MTKPKTKILFLFLILILNSQFGIVKAQVAQEWVRRFCDTSNTSWGGSAIKSDSQGNIYILAEGGNDFGFLKYNSNGDLLVYASYWPGGFDNGSGSFFDVSPYGDVYITGAVEINTVAWIYTVKFNSNGVLQWGKPYNYDNSDEPSDLKIDNAGNVIIVGGATIGSTGYALTIKYNSAGDTLWTKHFNTPNNSADNQKVFTDISNNIYITGSTGIPGKCLIQKYNSSGNLIWYNTFTFDSTRSNSGSGISLDNFGNIYITGGQIRPPYGDIYYYLLKLNNNGSIQWGQLLGRIGNSGSDVKGPVISSDGNSIYYSTAAVNGLGGGGYSIATIKYNSLGDSQWVSIFNGGGVYGTANLPGNIKLDKYGNIYVCGTGNFQTTGDDYVTIKYNSAGTQQWFERYSGVITNQGDYANDLFIDTNLNVYVTGQSWKSSGYGYAVATIKYNQPDGIISNSKEIPKKIELYQNYPNPFNPTTKIKFSLPIPSKGGAMKIILKIYDILGREVSTLINENLQPGTYEVVWPVPSGNALNYPSGVYFYKLETENFSQTNKMILIK